jgi:hypothetical protein
MNYATLQDVGTLLYGPHWVACIADAIGVTPQTIYAWRNLGTVPDKHQLTILMLVDIRIAQLREVKNNGA